MKYTKHIASAVMAFAALTAVSQTSHTSYFLENMTTRHELNPAFATEYNYVNIPVVPGLSGLAVGMNGNIGLDKFLFKRNGELVTGLNNSVSTSEFLGGLNSNNYMEANIKYDIFSMGFKKWGGFNTIGLSLKSNTGIELPYDLFAFAKQGQIGGERTEYAIGNTRVSSTNYVELAFGHSRKITDKITVGAKFKYLAGLARADVNITQIDVTMGVDKWSIREAGEIFHTDVAEITYKPDGQIDDIDYGKLGLAGNGVGIDLGVTYKLLPDLTLSAALTDIGFIAWSGNKATLTNKSFDFDGFHHIGAEDDDVTGESALDIESDQLEDDLKELVRFDHSESASSTQSLATTLNIGAEYSILKNKISFGFLSSTRFAGYKTWSEAMVSANFRPTGWFNAAVNGSVSNLGNSFGLLLNFCPKGFNFYIGSDYIPTKYAKQGVPVSSSKINAVIGMSITFGYPKKA